MKEAKWKHEEIFRAFCGKASDAVMVADRNGRFLYVNDAAAEALGYTREEFLQLHVSDIEAGESPEDLKKHIEDILQGKRLRFESVNKKKDGSLVDVDVAINIFEKDGEQVMYGTWRDITERKRREESVRTQRELALALSSTSTLEDGLHACVEVATHLAGMDCGGVYLIDDISGEFELVFHKGLPPDFTAGAAHVETNSPQAHLIKAGKPVYSRHQELDLSSGKAGKHEGLKAIAVLPIHHKGRVIGCLNIASHTLYEVPVASRTVLEMIALQIGNAVARLKTEDGREMLIDELKRALADARTLKGLIPICSSCKKIRDDDGDWQPVEVYISDRSNVNFTHGLCPECADKTIEEAGK